RVRQAGCGVPRVGAAGGGDGARGGGSGYRGLLVQVRGAERRHRGHDHLR
ncbi:transketolase 1, partial [Serratia marcescens]